MPTFILGSKGSGKTHLMRYASFPLQKKRFERDRLRPLAGARVDGYTEPFPGSPGLTNLINDLWANVYVPLFCPGAVYTPIAPGQSVSIDSKTCQTGRFDRRLEEHNFSWRGAIDFRPTAGILLYVRVAKSYKNGSFPVVSAPTSEQYLPVTQESVLDYDAGFKARLANGAITVNGSMFQYDYRDKQVRAKTVNPIFGLLDQLVNVPRSRIRGAEIELTAHPVSGLTLQGSATWLDTRVQRYDGIVGATRINGLLFPVRATFTGVALPFAPRFQMMADADYAIALARAWKIRIGATLTAQTRSYASLALAPQDQADALLPGRALLDLRGDVESADGRWRIELWGRNVTNRFYVTNALRSYDTIVRYAGRPAEYGVTLGYRWG